MTLTPNIYQLRTHETDIYTEAAQQFIQNTIMPIQPGQLYNQEGAVDMLSYLYCGIKLNGEAGEVAELIGKAFREGHVSPETLEKLFKELGDIMWYVSELATLCGFKLQDIMQGNLDKLADRKERGVIHGYGDDR